MFRRQEPSDMPWFKGEVPTRVITYFDERGNRYFLIRPRGDKWDMRLVVQGQTTVDEPRVSAKRIEITARTLGFNLPEGDLLLLTQSTLHSRVAR
jgi:hypothetical protein